MKKVCGKTETTIWKNLFKKINNLDQPGTPGAGGVVVGEVGGGDFPAVPLS